MAGLRVLLPLATLTAFAALAPGATSAVGPDQVWVGQAWEQDDYNPGTTLNGVHPSCHSTVGVATLTHDNGWTFATINDDCVGFNHSFDEADCSTDASGVFTCSDVPAPPGISVAMTFTPVGHVTVDFYGAGSFAGGHYHVEGDLSKL